MSRVRKDDLRRYLFPRPLSENPFTVKTGFDRRHLMGSYGHGGGTMRLSTPVLHLPRVRINTERGLRVPMPDGTILLADRYAPAGAGRPPTILVRTPYGRRGASAMINGLPFAYLGFQVLVQSVRGTFGSGGEV